MRITDALLGEHGALYALFDHVEAAIARAPSLLEMREVVAILAAALASHARLEDELLFPVLEHKLGAITPLAVMHVEHQVIDEALSDALAETSRDDAVALVTRALAIARQHFVKEERFLFALADDTIAEAELERLGASWAQRRRVELAACAAARVGRFGLPVTR